MADRYAAQRSSRETRRRSLPRLSDTATALADRAHDDEIVDVGADAGAVAAEAAVPVRPAHRTVAPRRASALAHAAAATQAATRVDYHYVIRDLRRIAVTAVVMLVLLIVLNIAVENLIH